MNLERAAQIHGFTTELELAWLAREAGQRQMIAEIGSWKGRSARAMADNTAGIVYACDSFRGSKEEAHSSELAGKDPDYLWELFRQNTSDCKNLLGIRMHSIAAATWCKISKLSFDMIFIDAAHDYDNVKADILAWRPLLRKGGLLCGHDFDGGRPGVVQAVRELIPQPRMAGAGSIWVAG